MKILALVGSGRADGNTARVVNLLETYLRREADTTGEPFTFETVNLSRLDIGACRGCRACFDRGETHCPLHDDLLPLRARIQAVDALIVATPVYVDDVSGIVKTWIDRMAFACHRPEFGDKSAYFVATTGGGPAYHTLRSLNALGYMGFHVIGGMGFKTGALMEPAEIEARYSARIARAARAVFRTVQRKAYLRPSFYALVTFRIQQLAWGHEDPGSVDYAYWRDQGWLDPHCRYYLPGQRAGRIKMALAWLAGAILYRAFGRVDHRPRSTPDN